MRGKRRSPPNREIGFVSFVRAVRACVRACERAKLCVRVRESVLPTARVGELKISSGTDFRAPLPELIVEENCWFSLQMGGPAQPASQPVKPAS